MSDDKITYSENVSKRGSLKYFTDIKYSTLMNEDVLILHKMIE